MTVELNRADMHDHTGHPKAYVRLPPGRGYLLAPADSRSSLLPSLPMIGGSTPRSRVFQRAAYAAVRLAGPQVLAGSRVPWQAPFPAEDWLAALDTWEEALSPVDYCAVYQAPQKSRQGCTVLGLRGGQAKWIVKTGPTSDARHPGLETTVLSLMHGDVRAVRIPRLLARGEISVAGEQWPWFAQELLSTGLHGPARFVPLGQLEHEIRRSLADSLPRPTGTPGHWTPIHGDLAPWNLRQSLQRRDPDSRPFLIDWESTRWGPPGADAVYLWLTSEAIGVRGTARDARKQLRSLSPESREECRVFWSQLIGTRSRDDADAHVTTRMLGLLRRPATV